MDDATRIVRSLRESVLPDNIYNLSYSADWRYQVPANDSRTNHIEEWDNTRLQYSTFLSTPDRGVLLTRVYHDMRVEPMAVGTAGEKKKLTLSDYKNKRTAAGTTGDKKKLTLSDYKNKRTAAGTTGDKKKLTLNDYKNKRMAVGTTGDKMVEVPVVDREYRPSSSTTGAANDRKLADPQNLSGNFPALPPTDSAYASASVMWSDFDKFSRVAGETGAKLAESSTEQDISDSATVYSDSSAEAGSNRHGYIRDLANDILNKVEWLNSDDVARSRVSEILPDLLKAFAQKIGYLIHTQIHRDIMVFVHKHRHEIAAAIEDTGFDQHGKESDSRTDTSDSMSLDERMKLWYGKDSFSEAQNTPFWPMGSAELERPEEDRQDVSPDAVASEKHETNNEGLPTNNEAGKTPPGVVPEVAENQLVSYHDFINGSEAYEWLVNRLNSEFRLTPTEPNTIRSIGKAIMSSLPSPSRISKSAPTQTCSARFELQWDIFHFFETQEYKDRAENVLESVITLTGGSLDAQASTCAQYMQQTWPSSGQKTLELIKEILKDGEGHIHTCELSDGTTLRALSSNSKFVAEANGVAISVTEIGEQLAWLGSALRTSPWESEPVQSTPRIKVLPHKISSPQPCFQPLPADITCEITFIMEEAPKSQEHMDGQCWHNLFKNPVIVRGYPISRRAKWNTGLEMPLNIMAGLARTQRVDRFKGKVYIKGFGTMLIPIRRFKDILCWHLVYNEDGSRISYLDHDMAQEQDITYLDMENLRHVLGWCSKAKILAGSAEGRYTVGSSELPNPDGDCAFSRTWVSAGRIIMSGSSFQLGNKDTPVRISRQGYIPRLQWLSTKFVLLWDERDKRGWLINGTTALLHVLRASLRYDKEGLLQNEFLCNPEDLQEADNPFSADSAIETLVKAKNRSLKLFKDKDDELVLEGRINGLYNILEKLIDHQADIAGYCGDKLREKPRTLLEGWDFEDVMHATTRDLHARVASLESRGRSWVDLARAIHAVTFVGSGFGNIIRPANDEVCSHWTELPKHKYYMACCFSDLSRVVKQHGSLRNPFVRLSHDLIWHTPRTMFEFCECKDADKDECEPVQALFPSQLSSRLPPRTEAISPEECGALIFGASSHFPWVWGDGGPPYSSDQRNVLPEAASNSSKDSGTGSSRTGLTSYSGSSNSLSRPPSNKRPRLSSSLSCRTYQRASYRVGIICALPKELKAVRVLFDSEHSCVERNKGDDNQYVLGTMESHMVAAVCLPAGEIGTNSAASVASNMKQSFPELQFCLLVGISGGAPSEQIDIRVGDVIVGIPQGKCPAIVQYDLGKDKESNLFEVTGSLRGPPRTLTSAINALLSIPGPSSTPLKPYIDQITKLEPDYRRPAKDILPCVACKLADKGCPGYQVLPRARCETMIHYGPIGSGNSIIKNAKRRDKLACEHGVLGFEMEAAGVVNAVPCLVIRGICDYCDVHKNDDWQNYAAAAAAAYSKLLLSVVSNKEDGFHYIVEKNYVGNSAFSAGPKRGWSEFEEDRYYT